MSAVLPLSKAPSQVQHAHWTDRIAHAVLLLVTVALFVFLLVPEAATPAHLEVLAEIAEMLSDRAFRASPMACPDAHALHQAIASWSTLAKEPAP